MRRTSKLPSDWKQRIETSIRNGESPFSPSPSNTLDEQVRKELADSGIQNDMLRRLKEDVVEIAAEFLWKHTEGRPTVQKKVPVYIHRALYWIAWASKARPKERPVSEYRRIVKTLEQVRDDAQLVLYLDRKGEEFRYMMERAAEYYRSYESSAQRTKPRDMRQRIVLSILRNDFRAYFGGPMNQAVAYLMEAAFGGTWDANTVRTRASEWRC